MEGLKEQLLEAWQTNQRMNLLLFNCIRETGFQRTAGARGRSILQQWIHIHTARLHWLDECAKDLASTTKAIDKDNPPAPEAIAQSMESSSAAISQLIERCWENGGKMKGFRKGIIPFIGYLISHESHHRGSMMLVLKLAGEKVPDPVKWGLWEWGK